MNDALQNQIVTGIITALVALLFFCLSSRELRRNLKRLEKQNDIMLDAMEEANLVEINRDKHGKVVGIIKKAKGTAGAVLSAIAKPTVIKSGKGGS
ncbi:MAG: hypothetical protein ABFD52_05745 [Acidobacteriota bacterium]